MIDLCIPISRFRRLSCKSMGDTKHAEHFFGTQHRSMTVSSPTTTTKYPGTDQTMNSRSSGYLLKRSKALEAKSMSIPCWNMLKHYSMLCSSFSHHSCAGSPNPSAPYMENLNLATFTPYLWPSLMGQSSSTIWFVRIWEYQNWWIFR